MVGAVVGRGDRMVSNTDKITVSTKDSLPSQPSQTDEHATNNILPESEAVEPGQSDSDWAGSAALSEEVVLELRHKS